MIALGILREVGKNRARYCSLWELRTRNFVIVLEFRAGESLAITFFFFCVIGEVVAQ